MQLLLLATIASGSYYLLLFVYCSLLARVFFFFVPVPVLVPIPIFIFIPILFGFIHVFQVQTAVREPRKRITFKLVKAAGWVVQGGAGRCTGSHRRKRLKPRGNATVYDKGLP